MNQHAMPSGEVSLRPRAIPWPVWVLLLGAIAQLGVQIAPDSYQVFGPYFLVDGGMVVSWLQSITPFLLAAAVILGADRWPAGRRALLAAAVALAVVGLLRLGLDVWWALWATAPGVIPDGTHPWLIAAYAGAACAAAAANGLMATGLWAARPDRPGDRTRAAFTIAIAVTGLVATGAGLWVVVLTFGFSGPDDARWVGVLTATLTAGGFAGLAALAIAAVRIARPADRLPEILIGTGAVVTMVASAWTWVFPHVAPIQAWAEDAVVWVFTIPTTAALTGTLAMIAGFGLAAFGVRRAMGDRAV